MVYNALSIVTLPRMREPLTLVGKNKRRNGPESPSSTKQGISNWLSWLNF
jgi:hypothetical protein